MHREVGRVVLQRYFQEVLWLGGGGEATGGSSCHREERSFWRVASQNIQLRKRLSGLVTMVFMYVFTLHVFHTYLMLLDFQFYFLGCFGLEIFFGLKSEELAVFCALFL